MEQGETKTLTRKFSTAYEKVYRIPMIEDFKMDKSEKSETAENVSSKMEANRAALQAIKEKRCVSLIKIIWAFISFLIAVADVVVIIVVTWLHFVHQQDILAWMMLLPILLNFIGIFTFLSNENERKQFEELGGNGNCKVSALVKNLMILPVFGPAFSSLRLFFYSIQEKDAEKFERLESLLIKMKQYESFFRAAPEAFLQITHRIVNWTNGRTFDYEDHWTTGCIVLCVFSLAESNFYGVIKLYYRIFTDPDKLPKDSWKTEKVAIRWRVLLFIFTYYSILSRLLSEAILRATACFIFEDRFSFGEVIAISFIVQFVVRAMFHALILRKRENISLARGTITNFHQESGTLIYRAFTYSWRSVFMSFDFQSPDICASVWFYCENFLAILTGYLSAYFFEYNLREKSIYFVYTGTAFSGMFIAVFIKLTVKYCYKKKKSIAAHNQSETGQSGESEEMNETNTVSAISEK